MRPIVRTHQGIHHRKGVYFWAGLHQHFVHSRDEIIHRNGQWTAFGGLRIEIDRHPFRVGHDFHIVLQFAGADIFSLGINQLDSPLHLRILQGLQRKCAMLDPTGINALPSLQQYGGIGLTRIGDAHSTPDGAHIL